MSTFKRTLSLLISVLVGWSLLSTGSIAQDVQSRLAAGEFAAALRAVDQISPAERDPVLAQIASAQSTAGETVAAGGTLRGVESASSREQMINGARGGGAFADFQSLIDLIQTTVVPDTWEVLGGPSTMAPYPQGVYVDAAGTVRECEVFAPTTSVDDLKALLSGSDDKSAQSPLAWRNASPMRCVSLRRLADEWTQHRLRGEPLPESMTHLAGLSRIQFLFLDGDDIVLAGPVGGIDTIQGWHRDRSSGLSTIRFDALMTCLRSAIDGQPFGCTIDPTTEGLVRAASVAASVRADRIPIGKAANEMVAALGMQRVEVFGTAGDTPLGYLMVEADRHMKQLALGIHPMPRGAMNYLDVIDATIDQGPPDELLLRLWFTSSPRSVRTDANRKVFELAGTPIRLSGQNELAMATGQRGNVTHDFRTDLFVDDFNKNWNAIRTKYPLYGALESIYQAASVAELLRRHVVAPSQQSLVSLLAGGGSESSSWMPTPRQVESITKLHSIRKGNRRYHVLLASGGVAIDSRQTLVSKMTEYPSLGSINNPGDEKPRVIQHWWWDAR